MQRLISICMGLIALMILLGCDVLPAPTPQAQSKVVQNSREKSTVAEQIKEAEQLWKSQNITNYRITMSLYENFGSGRTSERTSIIRDGKLASSSCTSVDCPVFVLMNVRTVDDLFWMVKGGTMPGPPDECLHSLTFDAAFGYPTSISVDCPSDSDEENSIKVIGFEVLK